ncbi:MAG: ThuA domain-containing protein, partial [Verrucomicrobiota bacterium]
MKLLSFFLGFLISGFVPLSSAVMAADTPSYPHKKMLFFSKSSGFEHGVVKRTNGQPSFLDKLLTELGAKNNIEFVCSKDGSLFSKEYLAQFDAFLFYATGDLTEAGDDGNPPMSPQGKQALLDAVAGGKGFVGVHSAADAFHGYATRDMGPKRWHVDPEHADPFIKMVGCEFIKHDNEATASLIIADPKFPGISA